MKEFLLSLISPLKMKRFRFMSVFISMLIFVVSIYFLAIPHQVYMKANKEEYLLQKSYVNAYMNISENISMGQDFINAGYKIDENKEMTSKSSLKGVQKYEYDTIEVQLLDQEPKNINFYVVFDIEDSVVTELNDANKLYEEKYPDDTKEKKSYASYLYYVDKIKQENVTSEWTNKKLEELHNTEESTLSEKMKKLTNFDLFNINVNDSENNYLLMFFKKYAVSQIAYYDENAEKMIYPALNAYYETGKLNFDFTNTTTLTEFGNHFAYTMFEPLYQSDQTEYLLQVVGYVLIFPAIFVLLLCWSMKKRGIMKTYKEYYNVAAISSIMPLLITFAVSWFFPKAVLVYGGLFCMFTLFVFIKINSTPELGD